MGDAAGGRDIHWHELDKPRFVVYGCSLFLAVRALVFPASLVKTRLQVYDGKKSTAQVVQEVFRRDGIRGFYRGFPTTALGVMPAQLVYMTVYEASRAKARLLPLPHGWGDQYKELTYAFIAGGVASMASQCIVVPIDIISQKLMVSGLKNVETYSSGREAFQRIVSEHGVRGLYRGMGLSLLTYAPSSAIWWGTYASARSLMMDIMPTETLNKYLDDRILDVGVQSLCGVAAGLTAAVLTNPMDVIKTRFQVLNDQSGKQANLRSTISTLIREEGLAGLQKGMFARVVNMATVSTLMVVVYELVKRLSVADQAPTEHMLSDVKPAN